MQAAPRDRSRLRPRCPPTAPLRTTTAPGPTTASPPSSSWASPSSSSLAWRCTSSRWGARGREETEGGAAATGRLRNARARRRPGERTTLPQQAVLASCAPTSCRTLRPTALACRAVLLTLPPPASPRPTCATSWCGSPPSCAPCSLARSWGWAYPSAWCAGRRAGGGVSGLGHSGTRKALARVKGRLPATRAPPAAGFTGLTANTHPACLPAVFTPTPVCHTFHAATAGAAHRGAGDGVPPHRDAGAD